MDFKAGEIIPILAFLADSENLEATLNEDSRYAVFEAIGKNLRLVSTEYDAQYTTLRGVPQGGYIDSGEENIQDENPSAFGHITTWLQRISVAGILGMIFTGLQVTFSRTWTYIFHNHQLTVNVKVAPVSAVLQALPTREQNVLTQRIQRIMEQNSITTYESLAAHIQNDDDTVKRIVLKYLTEYFEKDLSMPIN